jgi:hypothetical protein
LNKQLPLQFSLLSLLAAAPYLALAFGIGRMLESPQMVAHLMLLLLGWVLHRFANAHIGGLIPLLLGFDILFCHGISWVYHGYEGYGFVPHEMVLLLSSIPIVISVAVFSCQATYNRQHRIFQASIALVSLVLLAGWCVVVPAIGKTAIATRQSRETVANKAAMTNAVDQIETLRLELGRVPEESELNDLLTEPLPEINWDGWNTRIKYQKTGDDKYQLWYTNSDVYNYDSSTPDRGWYSEPF